MIVYAAVVPHNPLQLQDPKFTHSHTARALQIISQDCAALRVDTVCVISEHAGEFLRSFTLPFSDIFRASLKEFGRVQDVRLYRPNYFLLNAITCAARAQKLSLQKIAAQDVEYGVAIPLHLLAIPEATQLVIIGTSHRSIADHVVFGSAIKEVFQQSNARIAIIVAGDGSHRHESTSPAGFSPRAAEFEDALMHVLRQRSTAALQKLSQSSVEVAECLVHPLAIAYGLIRRFPLQTEVLSYEIRSGVGLYGARLFHE